MTQRRALKAALAKIAKLLALAKKERSVAVKDGAMVQRVGAFAKKEVKQVKLLKREVSRLRKLFKAAIARIRALSKQA